MSRSFPDTCHLALWLLIPVLLVTQTACTFATPSPLPTATSAPTDTPQPSVTPTSTYTSTPTPTLTPSSTPNYLATRFAKSTATMEAKLESVSPVLANLGLSTETGKLAWYEPESIYLTVKDYNTITYTQTSDDKVGDFVFHSVITWDSTSGLAGCGLVLRSNGNMDTGKNIQFYLMRLQNAPAWEMFYVNYHYIEKYLTRYKFDDGINDGKDSKNTIDLVVQGNQFTPYINGLKKITMENNDLLSQGYIYVMVNQESGYTSCNFQNSWIWSLD